MVKQGWKHWMAQAAFVILVILIPVGFGLFWLEHLETKDARETAFLNCQADNRLIRAFVLTHPDGPPLPLLPCEAP